MSGTLYFWLLVGKSYIYKIITLVARIKKVSFLKNFYAKPLRKNVIYEK
jgi:hypothetical protein